jgi:hypothetical protein
MSPLILKLTLAPSLVIAVSVAGRRFGPMVSGMLVGLPIVAGPILFLLTLEQGVTFAAQAAYGCGLGVTSLALFCLTFVHAGKRFAWPACVLLGWLVVAASTALMRDVPQTFWLATLISLLGVTSVLALLAPPAQTPPALPPPLWDLPLRMLATASMVSMITALGAWLGPGLSGLLTPFPVATTVLAAFAHAQLGPAGSTRLLRGLLFGLYGFLCFCVSLGALLTRTSVAAAFTLALAACLLMQGMVVLAMRRGLAQ